jgi:hypothetical protein
MEIWEANGGDIIMLGSSQPWKSDRDIYQRIFALERPRKDLESIGLMGPEMLMARQFASQRTATVVVGPGPIQSDDFPVLEYRAPMAFYMGLKAQRLFFFDERTWQMDMAPAHKTSLLATLDLNALKTVFGHNTSVNPQLRDYLRQAWEGKLCSVERTGGGNWMPCAFGITNCGPMHPLPGISTNDVLRRLFEAELVLDSTSDAAAQAHALGEITAVLQEADPGWPIVHYTSLAVKGHLRRGDGAAAKRVLLRGMQLRPDLSVFQYLGRILVHEGIIQPSELAGPGPGPRAAK